jgi:hypothetical protein
MSLKLRHITPRLPKGGLADQASVHFLRQKVINLVQLGNFRKHLQPPTIMFASARQILRQNGNLKLLASDLPEKYTLPELDEQLRIEGGAASQPRLENVFILRTCLDHEASHLSRISGDDSNTESIVVWISTSTLPDKSLGSGKLLPSLNKCMTLSNPFRQCHGGRKKPLFDTRHCFIHLRMFKYASKNIKYLPTRSNTPQPPPLRDCILLT